MSKFEQEPPASLPKNDESLQEFVEMHEFPNRIIFKNGGIDLNGKEIPAKSIFILSTKRRV